MIQSVVWSVIRFVNWSVIRSVIRSVIWSVNRSVIRSSLRKKNHCWHTKFQSGNISVPLHLRPFNVDMSSDVMWYSGQSYPVIYQATRGLGLVKRLRCGFVLKQKYSFKGVEISGKFDQYFPVTTYEQPPTDLKKTCYWHDHCEPDHWPLAWSHYFPRSSIVPSLTPCDRIVVIT